MKRGYSAVLLCTVLLFSCGIVSAMLSENGDNEFIEPDLNRTGGETLPVPPEETTLFDSEDESGSLEEDDPVEQSGNVTMEEAPHSPPEEYDPPEDEEEEVEEHPEELFQPEEILESTVIFAEEMPLADDVPLDVYGRPLYEPGSILVQFKPPVAENTILMATTSDYLNALHQTTTRLDLTDYGQPGLLVINLPDDLTVPDAINRFSRYPDILFAEPNFYYYLDKIPNDPEFPLLWGLQNTGQTVGGQAGTPGADISAPGAWDITTGSKDVVIAVIDSGIHMNHLDLIHNQWMNPGELINGYDSDGNGYIDDLYGWNFYDDNNDVSDLNGHGTHCAGTIAAIGDDNWGIPGVMWTAKIMPLKFTGPHGAGTTANAIKAINYSRDNGAHIISNSWGSTGYSEGLKNAIESFNGVVICAAGNNATNNDIIPYYPSSYNSSNIISVAATDNNDALSDFSCYGANTVHVGAPGTMIYSTYISYEYEERFFDPMTSLDNWSVVSPGPWELNSSIYYSPPTSASDNSNYSWVAGQRERLRMKTPVRLEHQYQLPEFSFMCNYSLDNDTTFVVWTNTPTITSWYSLYTTNGSGSDKKWKEIIISPKRILEAYDHWNYSGVLENISGSSPIF